jgi:hypothetical protein
MPLQLSQMIDFVPPPVLLGAMWSTDKDGAWLINATAAMQRRNTTIAAIGTTIVQRRDGNALGPGDPTVTDGIVQGGGLQWSFSVTTAGNVAKYFLGFPLALANGDAITRWFELPVVSLLG